MAENFNFSARSEDLFQEAIRAFASWAAKNWVMKEGEANQLTEPSPCPREYERGYNDGIKSIEDAVELWLEEGL